MEKLHFWGRGFWVGLVLVAPTFKQQRCVSDSSNLDQVPSRLRGKQLYSLDLGQLVVRGPDMTGSNLGLVSGVGIHWKLKHHKQLIETMSFTRFVSFSERPHFPDTTKNGGLKVLGNPQKMTFNMFQYIQAFKSIMNPPQKKTRRIFQLLHNKTVVFIEDNGLFWISSMGFLWFWFWLF